MGPNLYFKMPVAKKTVAKTGCNETSNSARFWYNAICHNTMQDLMFVLHIGDEINENKIKHIHIHLDTHKTCVSICIYVYIHSDGGHGQENVLLFQCQ